MSRDLLVPLTMAALAGLAASTSARAQTPDELAKATAADLAANLGDQASPEIIATARYDVDELGELARRVEALELELKTRPAEGG